MKWKKLFCGLVNQLMMQTPLQIAQMQLVKRNLEKYRYCVKFLKGYSYTRATRTHTSFPVYYIIHHLLFYHSFTVVTILPTHTHKRYTYTHTHVCTREYPNEQQHNDNTNNSNKRFNTTITWHENLFVGGVWWFFRFEGNRNADERYWGSFFLSFVFFLLLFFSWLCFSLFFIARIFCSPPLPPLFFIFLFLWVWLLIALKGNVSIHEHTLSRAAMNDGWMCDGVYEEGGCRRKITDFNQTTGIPRMRCDACDFDLCDLYVSSFLPSFCPSFLPSFPSFLSSFLPSTRPWACLAYVATCVI